MATKKQSNLKYWVDFIKKYDLEFQSKGREGKVKDVLDSIFEQYEHGDSRLWGLYLKMVQMPQEITLKQALHIILRDIIKYAQEQAQNK